MLAAAATAIVLFGGGAPAVACSPCPYLSDEEKQQRTEAVVEGVVTDVDRPWTGDRWSAELRVDRVLKGDPGATLRLDTEPPGTDCGGPLLREGYRYRLYLTRAGGRLVPAYCAGSVELSGGPVLPWWRIHDESLFALAGFLLSNVLAAAVLRSRRRRRSRDPRSAGRTRPARSVPSM
jgi:hypothetical protein